MSRRKRNHLHESNSKSYKDFNNPKNTINVIRLPDMDDIYTYQNKDITPKLVFLDTISTALKYVVPCVTEEIIMQNIEQFWKSEQIKELAQKILSGDYGLYKVLIETFILNPKSNRENKIEAMKYLLILMRCYSDCLDSQGIKYMIKSLTNKLDDNFKSLILNWIANCIESSKKNRLEFVKNGLIKILIKYININVSEKLIVSVSETVCRFMNYEKDEISIKVSSKCMPKYLLLLSHAKNDTIIVSAIATISTLLVTMKCRKNVIKMNTTEIICEYIKRKLNNNQILICCFQALKNLSHYDQLKSCVMCQGAGAIIRLILNMHENSIELTKAALCVMLNLCFNCKNNCIIFTYEKTCENVINAFQTHLYNNKITTLACMIISEMSKYHGLAKLEFIKMDAGAILKDAKLIHPEHTTLVDSTMELLGINKD